MDEQLQDFVSISAKIFSNKDFKRFLIEIKSLTASRGINFLTFFQGQLP
jgi:hypothetical protein